MRFSEFQFEAQSPLLQLSITTKEYSSGPFLKVIPTTALTAGDHRTLSSIRYSARSSPRQLPRLNMLHNLQVGHRATTYRPVTSARSRYHGEDDERIQDQMGNENFTSGNVAPNSHPPTPTGNNKRHRDDDDDILSSGPRKRPSRTDPLVSNGRHFGRTIHAFCRILPLIKESLARYIQIQAKFISYGDLTDQEKREHKIFEDLLSLSPGLDSRILKASQDELHYIADMLSKGSSGARADDTKSLKSVVIDWITPKGGALVPPLSRNVKTDRGYFHYTTGRLLCPATLNWDNPEIRKKLKSGEIASTGDQWPVFLYLDDTFNPENPWDGLLQGQLLVNAFRHVFTSPSSVELQKETRATRSGNAELHGMRSVTVASLAYIATLVRFSLTSSAVFTRNDKVTDSERFYRSLIDFLELPTEFKEVDSLLRWWNLTIFPAYHNKVGPSSAPYFPSVMDKLKEWRQSFPPHHATSSSQSPNSSPQDLPEEPPAESTTR